jgi:hypothetical protein
MVAGAHEIRVGASSADPAGVSTLVNIEIHAALRGVTSR